MGEQTHGRIAELGNNGIGEQHHGVFNSGTGGTTTLETAAQGNSGTGNSGNGEQRRWGTGNSGTGEQRRRGKRTARDNPQ
ncbi:hypothetical protein ACOMHN_000290 [Nucella lapillus]